MCEPSLPAYFTVVRHPLTMWELQNDDGDDNHNININSERLRYNTHKVAAFARRREMVGVFLAWSRKSAQLAMYVLPRAWLHCYAPFPAKTR